jgi:hypothetical protein
MNIVRIISILLGLEFFISQANSQNDECVKHFSFYDTISVNGNYIKYHVKNNNVTIEFGNQTFHRFLKDKITCDIADARIPHYIWDNNEFICLEYGCGSPCWGVLILPLNSKDTIRNIMYNLAFDPTNNLIAYLDNSNYDKIVIENLKTKVRQVIEFTKSCNDAFIGYCIDSISIRNNELYYRFAEPDKIERNRKLTEFKIRIK